MRPVREMGCDDYGLVHDIHSTDTRNCEFHIETSINKNSHHCKVSGSQTKPTPQKWDEAQRGLLGLSGRGIHGHINSNVHNFNADGMKLLRMTSKKERPSHSTSSGGPEEDEVVGLSTQDKGDTKKIDCHESLLRIHKPVENSTLVVRAVCVRDMATEMTPIASQEPSRTATPLKATTPELSSPMSSRSSTPRRSQQGQICVENLDLNNELVLFGRESKNGWSGSGEEVEIRKILEDNGKEPIRNTTSLESQAMAWDEAERAEYIARYKHEQVKIQAWENHQKRKAEREMRRMELKAEKLKSQAQESLDNKLAATRRRAEEKRAHAEAKLNKQSARASENADYVRRTGRLPFFFSFFNLCSFCRNKT